MRSPLYERIVNEISASGPRSFARFMELALADPEFGYYTSKTVRAGRGGDFITAPELHPLLGSAIARLVAATWERLGAPHVFRWIEFGAGSGALLLAALAQLHRDAHPLLEALEVELVELNTYRRNEALAHLAALPGGGPRVLEPTTHRTNAAPFGVVIANEYLDALPFHIVVGRAAAPHGFVERRVSVDAASGTLTWIEAQPEASIVDQLAARLASSPPLVEGQLAELSLAADAWVAELPSLLQRGLVVVLDYGRTSDLLRDPATRMAGTALAYQGHRATTDLLGDPGGQDLTAHVDLTALRRAAVAAGLTPVAATTQAAFLAAAGVNDELVRLYRGPGATLEGALALRAALARLMNPRTMGGFAVELFAMGAPEEVAPLVKTHDPLPGAAAPIRDLV